MDHNVPTSDRSLPIIDQISSIQIQTLAQNCKEFGITLFDMHSPDQGIVHIIGPELGLTLPGTTIVCGDSHTSTHGAFGAFALGIGTSDVEHVLATQAIWMDKPQIFAILKGSAKTRMPSPPRISYSTSSGLLALSAVSGTGILSTRRNNIRSFDGEQNDDMQHVDRGRCKGWHHST